MQHTPLVSVIVPVYNAQAYLSDCLSSLIRQTVSDLEIVLIDDGSTDESPAIIEAAAAGEDRIVFRRVKNGGPSRARNLGIELARGEWFCFVDADDFAEPDMIERLLDAAQNADVCVCAKKRWNQRTGRVRIDRCPAFYGDLAALKKRLFRYRRIMRGVTGRIYRGSVIRRFSLRFDESLRYGEDMTFHYLVCKHAENIAFLDRVLYTYRIHNHNSLSQLDNTSVLKQRSMQLACIRDTFGSV